MAKETSFVHTDSEDSGRMPRLICFFAGRTTILLVLSCHGSNGNISVCLKPMSSKHAGDSAVSYRVVEYRRQNGQCLLEDISVITQEMTEAQTAGVLFTNDTVTGNESVMIINAFFGLGGEAVVSGKVIADDFYQP